MLAIGFSQNTCLPSLRTADGVLGVHPIGQNDVDHIDLVVGRDFVVRAVVVDVSRIDAVLLFPTLRFLGRAGDDAFQLGVFRLLQGRSDLVCRQRT